MQWFNWVTSGLAAWRLAHLLMYERGPFDLVTKSRGLVGVRHDENMEPNSYPDNHVLECIYCTSFWTAAVLSPACARPVVNVLAINALAILVGKVIDVLDEV